MRRTSVCLLSLLPLVGFAQVPTEATFASLEKKLDALEQKYPGVKFDVPKADLKNGWSGLNYMPIQSDTNAKAYVDMLVEEFSKYPVDFIKACKLKRVEVVDKLAIGPQFRSAAPDYEHEVLYYDVSYVGDLRYARHVVHHEFFHMLEQEWNGDAFYKDPNWALMNEKDFKYGAGGADAYGRGEVWAFIHPRAGFLNVYSMYGLEEDKAEVWAVMFVPENWKLVRDTVAGDAILRGKVAYLREFARSKSSAMDDAFWKRVVGG